MKRAIGTNGKVASLNGQAFSIELEDKEVTTNGLVTPTPGKFLNSVNVNVPSSGGGGWQRPSAWGSYPSEFIAEKAKPVAERTMEAVYLLYRNNEEIYGSLPLFTGFKVAVNSGTYTVERGHMDGSTFTVDSTTTVNSNYNFLETFTNSMPEYILYRITPTTSGSQITYFAWVANGSVAGTASTVLEIYGRVEKSVNAFSFVNASVYNFDMLYYGQLGNLANLTKNKGYIKSINVKDWDTSAITDMTSMFTDCQCRKLDVSNWNTSNVTNMKGLFSGTSVEELDVSGWNTSNVTDMTTMFASCFSLANLDVSGFDTSKVTTMFRMFYYSINLRKLDCSNWDVTKVTNFINVFHSAPILVEIDCTGWDTVGVTNASNLVNMFPANLVDLVSPKFYLSVNVSACTKLSHDSLMSIINNLATVSTTQTLTLGATNMAKLTAEEIAIANGKGWSVA